MIKYLIYLNHIALLVYKIRYTKIAIWTFNVRNLYHFKIQDKGQFNYLIIQSLKSFIHINNDYP